MLFSLFLGVLSLNCRSFYRCVSVDFNKVGARCRPTKIFCRLLLQLAAAADNDGERGALSGADTTPQPLARHFPAAAPTQKIFFVP